MTANSQPTPDSNKSVQLSTGGATHWLTKEETIALHRALEIGMRKAGINIERDTQEDSEFVKRMKQRLGCDEDTARVADYLLSEETDC